MISLILARADDGAIGRAGTLPWRIPADMRRFKDLTMGKACLMGRKTWDSLPAKFRPLPGRTNIVVSRNPDYSAPGAVVVSSLAAGLDAALEAVPNAREVMIVGGARLYEAALSFASRVYLTEVHISVPDADVRFPAFDPVEWLETTHEDGLADDGVSYRFLTLERRDASVR